MDRPRRKRTAKVDPDFEIEHLPSVKREINKDQNVKTENLRCGLDQSTHHSLIFFQSDTFVDEESSDDENSSPRPHHDDRDYFHSGAKVGGHNASRKFI